MKSPIIITGGGQRLGLAIANNLADNNFDVVVSYRTQRPSLKSLRDKGVIAVMADFASQSGVNEFIQTVGQRFPKIRGIIHNASDWAAEQPNTDLAELFNRMMQIHASTPYQINLGLRDNLEAFDGVSDIIHMTDYVQDKGSKKHIAYAASKAALENLTLSFSALLAPKVKVNAIAPALVMFNQDDSEEYKQKALKKSLLEICPGAQEAVKAVDYLLSSDYMTGRTLHLDGGRHLK